MRLTQSRRLRRALIATAMTLTIGAAVAAVLLALVVSASGALNARPGAWTERIELPAGVSLEVNVPGLLRLATSPLGRWLLDGREADTRFGHVRFARFGPTLIVRCAPCRLAHPRLASGTVAFPELELQMRRAPGAAANHQLDGAVVAGRVRVPFTAALRAEAIEVHASLEPTPIAAAYRLFQDVVPEARVARIAGNFSARGRLVLPAVRASGEVTVAGVEVGALGTERYSYGAFTLNCPQRDGGARRVLTGDGEKPWIPLEAMGKLLPAAVIAAEDPSFATHAGFDGDVTAPLLEEREFALIVRTADAASGAADTAAAAESEPSQVDRSTGTLTQQLARTLFTGSDRTLANRLRELLYAAEMERTLGKARILELYLNTADWGPGLCGARAAARTYFDKTPARLTPLEAAWLAGILRRPHEAWREQYLRRSADRERAIAVLNRMPELSTRERQRWAVMPLDFARARRNASQAAEPALRVARR